MLLLAETQAGEEAIQTITDAVTYQVAVLSALGRGGDPVERARALANLGHARLALGLRQTGSEAEDTIASARRAYAAALEDATPERDLTTWSQIQYNLGHLENVIGDRGGGERSYRAARRHYQAIVEAGVGGQLAFGAQIMLQEISRKIGRN